MGRKRADVAGHYRWREKPTGPSPLCACGCGQPVGRRGRRFNKWIKGHCFRTNADGWVAGVFSPKESARWEYVRRTYGVTRATYERMLAEQGGCCAICFAASPGVGRGGAPRGWCIDHDHATNKIRGLLCAACNAAIGLLQDDPSVLLSAADYLLKRGK